MLLPARTRALRHSSAGVLDPALFIEEKQGKGEDHANEQSDSY